jgi:hypothetical protein
MKPKNANRRVVGVSVNNEDLGSSHEVLEEKGRDELKEMLGLGDTDIVAEIGLPKAGVAAALP